MKQDRLKDEMKSPINQGADSDNCGSFLRQTVSPVAGNCLYLKILPAKILQGKPYR